MVRPPAVDPDSRCARRGRSRAAPPTVARRAGTSKIIVGVGSEPPATAALLDGEPRGDPHVARARRPAMSAIRAIGRAPRAVERVAVAPGEEQGAIRELRGDLSIASPSPARSSGWRWTTKRFGDERSLCSGPPLALHRALDPALDLDRLEAGPEEAGRRPFEEAFEEPLDGPEAAWSVAESSRGSLANPVRARPGTLTFGTLRRYLRRRSPRGPLRYTLAPIGTRSRRSVTVTPRRGQMPEILTESFCERCGTRYTFESAEPKGKRLGKLKTFSKGLTNFVMSDDTSLDEAFAAARSDEQRELTAQQLDAFHQTFNFCMSVPPVHLRELLERDRGPLPQLRSASRCRRPRPG